MKKGKYTTDEIEFIRANYADYKTERLALMLNRSIASIYAKAYELGMKKSKEFLHSEACGRMIKGKSLSPSTQFKKGHTPANKGKNQVFRTKTTELNSAKTRFKKGHLPHNTKFDGCISVRNDSKTGRPYIYIRLAKAKWRLMHRVLWEVETGEKIPIGFNVIFKDSNPANCTIKNLELVSNADLMLRNTIHHYPDELKDILRLNAKLKREIKKIINKND